MASTASAGAGTGAGAGSGASAGGAAAKFWFAGGGELSEPQLASEVQSLNAFSQPQLVAFVDSIVAFLLNPAVRVVSDAACVAAWPVACVARCWLCSERLRACWLWFGAESGSCCDAECVRWRARGQHPRIEGEWSAGFARCGWRSTHAAVCCVFVGVERLPRAALVAKVGLEVQRIGVTLEGGPPQASYVTCAPIGRRWLTLRGVWLVQAWMKLGPRSSVTSGVPTCQPCRRLW